MTILRPSQFTAFNEREAVRIYLRHLPHWRQAGVTYFTTFRLADSIPDAIAQGWKREKAAWLKAHGIVCDRDGAWYRLFKALPGSDQLQFHRQFNRAAEHCLDRGLGECLLKSNSQCLEIVRRILLEGDGRSYHLGDFVIMPNHVHALITPLDGLELEMILKRIKGSSAVECNRVLDRKGAFWQPDSYDHIARSLNQLWRLREYIADNPATAGIALPERACFRATWMDGWFNNNEMLQE